MDVIKEYVLWIVLYAIFAVFALVLKLRKQYILSYVTSLVQKVEETVQGSGMGSEKKKIVVAQLEAIGVKVTAHLSTVIDSIVAELNEKNAWLTALKHSELCK